MGTLCEELRQVTGCAHLHLRKADHHPTQKKQMRSFLYVEFFD